MELFLSVLNCCFAVIGVAAVIRFAVWRLCSCGCSYDYLILLDGENSEPMLRGLLEKSKFGLGKRTGTVYAVDVGLNAEDARICELLSLDEPHMVFCRPEQLCELLKCGEEEK